MTPPRVVKSKKRMAFVFEGTTAPTLATNGSLWWDMSGVTPILKMRNKALDAWVPVDDAGAADVAIAGKLAALDAAATAITALGTALDETLAKTDVDDDGTIDGTELAALLSATNARVNEVATAFNALVTALKAVG